MHDMMFYLYNIMRYLRAIMNHLSAIIKNQGALIFHRCTIIHDMHDKAFRQSPMVFPGCVLMNLRCVMIPDLCALILRQCDIPFYMFVMIIH